jgi:hypothetical protein
MHAGLRNVLQYRPIADRCMIELAMCKYACRIFTSVSHGREANRTVGLDEVGQAAIP